MRRNNRNNTGRAEVNGETVEVVRHGDKNSRIRRLGAPEGETHLVPTASLANYRKESSDKVVDPSTLDLTPVTAQGGDEQQTQTEAPAEQQTQTEAPAEQQAATA
jgi:hypothetical protein